MLINWGTLSLLVIVVSGLAVWGGRRIAVRRGLLDIPNERSSHRVPVPRLVGAAFVPVLALALGLEAERNRRG
jgi:Fuc2NAc and GlcNAc transferase